MNLRLTPFRMNTCEKTGEAGHRPRQGASYSVSARVNLAVLLDLVRNYGPARTTVTDLSILTQRAGLFSLR
jgi:hypothetical protein